jgi:hypothetical protein
MDFRAFRHARQFGTVMVVLQAASLAESNPISYRAGALGCSVVRRDLDA